MKLFASLLGAMVVALAAEAAHALPALNDQANSTSNSTSARDLKAMKSCTPPATSVIKWWYSNNHGILRLPIPIEMKTCDSRFEDAPWTMLNAYRSGGTEERHWRHVKGDDYKDCLKDWTYYSKDGKGVIAKVEGYTTTIGDKDKKPWCALPGYRKGGVQGYQWEFCTCV